MARSCRFATLPKESVIIQTDLERILPTVLNAHFVQRLSLAKLSSCLYLAASGQRCCPPFDLAQLQQMAVLPTFDFAVLLPSFTS
jgi:hypothetical protein